MGSVSGNALFGNVWLSTILELSANAACFKNRTGIRKRIRFAILLIAWITLERTSTAIAQVEICTSYQVVKEIQDVEVDCLTDSPAVIEIISRTSPLSNPEIARPNTPIRYRGQFRFSKNWFISSIYSKTPEHLQFNHQKTITIQSVTTPSWCLPPT
jgi:hypothetical protein